mmetsp:Transcript_7816/g.20659  ORF Transcript_7816/g.20659 Transcript_7816/m.20659 type:complete len:210 (-) Transcript_7816:118-747(-)|eukprot:CAMPEP_0185832502 /NCGR_PEP_ID=MMETSP1353-20130828/2118_1 /TAXON_ID=1077150 /ORGANISM="Erythrolobus australicus, Strain CCMP3124" /LENGTH=209 /DNA_ID=CAMNT_0028530679 /DNA_START=44 /DNA_END=673 /DNA_ORIENTATION=+
MAGLKECSLLLLGSGSATRRLLLGELGYIEGKNLQRMPADIDERAIRHDDPAKLVLALGHAKADAIMHRIRSEQRTFPDDAVLLTADQVVVHEGRILEKPESAEEVRRNCAWFSQSPAGTVGSIVVTHLASGRRLDAVNTTEIYMRELPKAVVDQLITEGEVFYCAGGLRVEDPLVSRFVDQIIGGQDSVMGLTKATAQDLIHRVLSDV